MNDFQLFRVQWVVIVTLVFSHLKEARRRVFRESNIVGVAAGSTRTFLAELALEQGQT